MADHDDDHLARIAAYNEDDVRATRAVRDWLVDQRPRSVPWRAAVTKGYTADPDLDERIERLQGFDPGTPEHLMGDVLGYWRREKAVVAANCLRLSMASEAEQIESPSAIARLTFLGTEQVLTPTGRVAKWPAAVFEFPPQLVDADIRAESKLIDAVEEYEWAFFEVIDVDRDRGRLRLDWNEKAQSNGTRFRRRSCITPGSKRGSRRTRSRSWPMRCWPAMRTRVGHQMLRRALPAFVAGAGPADRYVHGRRRRHLWVGAGPRSQLRAHSRSAWHGQDLYGRAHHPYPRERGPAGGHHGDEPQRDRQPSRSRCRVLRRSGRSPRH